MADYKTDLLQIKIETARAKLSEETRAAIDAVNWRESISQLRETKGYNFEQLGDLEIQTELVLCGLLAPADYPKELEKALKIPKVQVDILVNDMNQLVFSKVRAEFIKRTENNRRQKEDMLPAREIAPTPAPKINAVIQPEESTINPVRDSEGSQLASISKGMKIIKPEVKAPEKKPEEIDKAKIQSIVSQKLSGSVQAPSIKTDYTLKNLPSSDTDSVSAGKTKVDPYRMSPDE